MKTGGRCVKHCVVRSRALSQLELVLVWGPQRSGTAAAADAHAAGLGIPSDLDLYVTFAVTDGGDDDDAATASGENRCMIYYGTTACGGAKLARGDALTEPRAPNATAAADGDESEYGVEVRAGSWGWHGYHHGVGSTVPVRGVCTICDEMHH